MQIHREVLHLMKKAVPLQTVISFSVINYVVSMRVPTRVAISSFFSSIGAPVLLSILYIFCIVILHYSALSL